MSLPTAHDLMPGTIKPPLDVVHVPLPPHRCNLPISRDQGGIVIPRGTILRCGTCSRDWWVWGSDSFELIWRRIRPWHLKKRRIIRQWSRRKRALNGDV